ncbi:MAG TPA: hypothetical protein DDY32_19150 [Desulfobulbaceae bacterium]|nr:hypothetical protein [Desulfobulbaceae bacterium]
MAPRRRYTATVYRSAPSPRSLSPPKPPVLSWSASTSDPCRFPAVRCSMTKP